MARIDLSALSWTLRGWRPFTWKLAGSMETAAALEVDVAAVPAKVPGSVQDALRRAGVIGDWNVGLNSRACEWVEHRHWAFTTAIPAGELPAGERVVLDAQGFDYSGWLVVDGREAGRFTGALLPHRFDLSAALGDGLEHRLGIVFEEPPHEQGQFGYTSQSRFFKPRYSYSWDWCPRLVPIGIWDTLSLLTGFEAAVSIGRLQATLDPDNRTGHLQAVVAIDPARFPPDRPAEKISLVLRDGLRVVASAAAVVRPGETSLDVREIPVEPWWPNGQGAQRLYDVELVVEGMDGNPLWSTRRRVGFKRVDWLPCEGAPAGALPWICAVNGRSVFLQGVNWSPIRAAYPDTQNGEYETLIALYQEMGCNLLRVWGGYIPEKAVFFDLCDQAGLLVWQEFPLSSSGIENWPPEDPAAIAELVKIGASCIERRAPHVSLLMWCGGNELQGNLDGGKVGTGKPVDESHPCLAALRNLVAREDPGRRFLPTSPAGPRFYATAADFGKGLHHEIHGPWGLGGFPDLDAWRRYWDADDALFRSEVGIPSAANAALLRKFSDGLPLWPPTSDYWRHTSGWWTQWDRFAARTQGLDPAAALDLYVKSSQKLQAELLAYAAASAKRRFPRCGGFLLWHGHDCFPCPAGNAIIDFEKHPKPVFEALRAVFRSQPGGMAETTETETASR